MTVKTEEMQEMVEKVGGKAIRTHCENHGKVYDEEMAHDATRDVIVMMLEEGKQPDQVDKLTVARESINAYKRERRRNQLYRDEFTHIALSPTAEEEEHSHLPPSAVGRPDHRIEAAERDEAWRQTLDPVQYTIARRISQGYTQREIASELRKGRGTIQHYISTLASAMDGLL